MRQGTYRPGRHGVQPVATGEPAKPPGLGRYGAQLWDEVEAHVIQMGAAECDSATLAGMCRWYDEYRRLANQLARTAVLDVAYRQVQVAASLAWQRFVETAGKFGLTPADRARLKTNIEERRGALDEMLARRQA